MSCKPDPNLSADEAEQAIFRVAQVLHDLIEETLRPSKLEGLARVNAFAWAIDTARNELPTSPAVSTVLGLHEPDLWGDMPQHVVALTADEIEQLYDNHAYAVSKTKKPRRGEWAPDFKASHEYHTTRAALFEPLRPKNDGEEDAPNPIYGEDGALIDMGGGPEVGA